MRNHPHGNIFDVEALVAKRDPDCTALLDVGNADMMAELADVLVEDFTTARSESAFPFRLIPRRHGNFMNSSLTNLAVLNRGKPYNPVYIHPDAIAALGLVSGGSVTVVSPHDSISCVAEADSTLRRDVVAMHHAFGGLPSEDDEFRSRGSNVGRLVATEVDYDPITGMPRQGNIAVRIVARDEATSGPRTEKLLPQHRG